MQTYVFTFLGEIVFQRNKKEDLKLTKKIFATQNLLSTTDFFFRAFSWNIDSFVEELKTYSKPS